MKTSLITSTTQTTRTPQHRWNNTHTLDCRINGGVPNKLVGVEIFSYQYEKFPKVRLGGGWKGAKNDYLGQ